MARSFCRICELGCGSVVAVGADGTVTVEPDPDNPYSRGYFCPKGRWAGYVETDPDRLMRPLLRRDGELGSASWSEALEVVGTRLRLVTESRGPNAIAVFSGNSAAYSGHLSLAVRNLMTALGTDSLFTAFTVDCVARYHVAAEALNLMYAVPVPYYDSVPGILLMGSNATVSQWSPGGSHPGGAKLARDLRARGGWLGVVDPVRQQVAELADEHLTIRPGTDAVFLAGLLAYIWQAGHANRPYVADHCQGLTAIADACADVTPPEVATVCGLDPDMVARVFREVATRPAVVLDRSGLSMSRHATVTAGLALAVNASLGRLDVADGLYVPDYSPVRGHASRGRPEGIRYGKEWPSALLASAILGEARKDINTALPDVKALIVVGGNPARSLPNSGRVAEALAALDLLVVIDIYPTETSSLAHVVLPGTAHYQRADFNFLSAALTPEHYRIWGDPIVPLGPEQREELWIAERIATAFAGAPVDGTNERFDQALADWGEAGPAWTGGVMAAPSCGSYLRDGFPTPSGRIEFDRPWAQAVPDTLASIRNSRSSENDTYKVAGRRLAHAVNSFLRTVPEAAKRGNPVLISPADAAALGLIDGETAIIESPSGRTEGVVRVSDKVPDGTIVLSHGWGHGGVHRGGSAAGPKDANANALTADDAIDRFCGMPVYQGHEVRVRRRDS